MSLSLIDILFLITIALLAFNGLRNGAIFSLVNLISIPAGFIVASIYGPRFTAFLAASGFAATPLISYIVLFFGTVLILHTIASAIRGVVGVVPLLGPLDLLAGGAIGFVEAWLLWLFLLIVLGSFLHSLQSTVDMQTRIVPGLHIQFAQLQSWHDFYNNTITNSLFAQVNSVFVKALPALPRPPS